MTAGTCSASFGMIMAHTGCDEHCNLQLQLESCNDPPLDSVIASAWLSKLVEVQNNALLTCTRCVTVTTAPNDLLLATQSFLPDLSVSADQSAVPAVLLACCTAATQTRV